MKPRITGAGMKAATQPMRDAPKSRKKAPIKIARLEVSALNSAVPCTAIAPTVSAEIRPVAVSGPTTSRREGAEQRVGNQWRNDCVESHDRRHADDAGIGHALWHHDRPDREAGQDIRQQPVASIAAKPAENGQQPLRDGGRASPDRHGPDHSRGQRRRSASSGVTRRVTVIARVEFFPRTASKFAKLRANGSTATLSP